MKMLKALYYLLQVISNAWMKKRQTVWIQTPRKTIKLENPFRKLLSLKVKNKKDSYGKFASRLPRVSQFQVLLYVHSLVIETCSQHVYTTLNFVPLRRGCHFDPFFSGSLALPLWFCARPNISCSQKASTPLEKSVRVEGEINIQVKPDRLVEQWKRKEARKYNDPDWLLGSRLIWSIVWYFELQMIIWLERL